MLLNLGLLIITLNQITATIIYQQPVPFNNHLSRYDIQNTFFEAVKNGQINTFIAMLNNGADFNIKTMYLIYLYQVMDKQLFIWQSAIVEWISRNF